MDNLPWVCFYAVAFFSVLAVIFFYTFGCGLNTGFGMAFRGNVVAASSLSLVSRASFFSYRGIGPPESPPFLLSVKQGLIRIFRLICCLRLFSMRWVFSPFCIAPDLPFRRACP